MFSPVFTNVFEFQTTRAPPIAGAEGLAREGGSYAFDGSIVGESGSRGANNWTALPWERRRVKKPSASFITVANATIHNVRLIASG